MGDRVLLAPLMWLGNSDHHIDFAGNALRPAARLPRPAQRTGRELHHARLPADRVRERPRRKHRARPAGGVRSSPAIPRAERPAAAVRDVLAAGQPAARGGPSIRQTQMGHACEWETSMILRLAPELVANHAAEPVELRGPLQPAHRGWITKDSHGPAISATRGRRRRKRGSTSSSTYAAGVRQACYERTSSPGTARAGRCRSGFSPVHVGRGVTTRAFGTPHPGSDSASAGSFATSCVDGPPSRLRASQHPEPPLSGAVARKRAKAGASAFVETTRTTTFPSAHTAVRSAIWGLSAGPVPRRGDGGYPGR